MHGPADDEHLDPPAPAPRPVPPGFSDALKAALRGTLPDRVAHSFALCEGKERVGLNFVDVSDQQQVIDAVSNALVAIESGFDYYPGIDISIWRP